MKDEVNSIFRDEVGNGVASGGGIPIFSNGYTCENRCNFLQRTISKIHLTDQYHLLNFIQMEVSTVSNLPSVKDVIVMIV